MIVTVSKRATCSAPGLALALVLALSLVATGCASRPDRVAGERQFIAELSELAPNVEAIDLEWHDHARDRLVPVRVYLPIQVADAGAQTSQRLPLVLFSHGLGGTRMGYSNLGRYWAAQGFIALHLQHPGSDRAIWGKRGFEMLSSVRDATTTEQAIARAQDVSFVLDKVLIDPKLSARIDPQRIGIAGHSFGANTALLAAGARFERAGATQALGDVRIKAAIIMSPPSLPAQFNPVYVYNPIAIPTLHLTGTNDHTPIPGLITNASDRRIPFDSIVAKPRFLGIFTSGRHTMFNDWSRDEASLRIKASTRELTVAFWRATLLGDETALVRLSAAATAADPLAAWEKY
jgi:predicted dienelactone hydrolase